MSPLLIGDLGTPELLIILAIVVLVFGASKLPELARGSGRALRIFKAETKGLRTKTTTRARPSRSSSSRPSRPRSAMHSRRSRRPSARRRIATTRPPDGR